MEDVRVLVVETGDPGAPLRLVEHRRRIGWSQLDLAIRAGVSVKTISTAEARRTRPGRRTSGLIAQALNVPAADVAELRAE